MVLRARFKKKLSLYVELKIYDKNRQKITGPQCVKIGTKQTLVSSSKFEILNDTSRHYTLYTI
jgi:hypothetical protein